LTLRIDGCASWALGKIGPDAKAAVPELERLAHDEDERVRREALDALTRIKAHEP
jgi:HEAT repeat protein